MWIQVFKMSGKLIKSSLAKVERFLEEYEMDLKR